MDEEGGSWRPFGLAAVWNAQLEYIRVFLIVNLRRHGTHTWNKRAPFAGPSTNLRCENTEETLVKRMPPGIGFPLFLIYEISLR